MRNLISFFKILNYFSIRTIKHMEWRVKPLYYYPALYGLVKNGFFEVVDELKILERKINEKYKDSYGKYCGKYIDLEFKLIYLYPEYREYYYVGINIKDAGIPDDPKNYLYDDLFGSNVEVRYYDAPYMTIDHILSSHEESRKATHKTKSLLKKEYKLYKREKILNSIKK